MLFNLTPINNYDRSRCFIYHEQKSLPLHLSLFIFQYWISRNDTRESETRQERKRKKIGNLAERKFFHLAKKKKKIDLPTHDVHQYIISILRKIHAIEDEKCMRFAWRRGREGAGNASLPPNNAFLENLRDVLIIACIHSRHNWIETRPDGNSTNNMTCILLDVPRVLWR